ncbi:MAG: hypothetical protein J6O41_02700 [Clostridia bacterium]|nr:hypothetical protein [Clostridia bacterium]
MPKAARSTYVRLPFQAFELDSSLSIFKRPIVSSYARQICQVTPAPDKSLLGYSQI